MSISEVYAILKIGVSICFCEISGLLASLKIKNLIGHLAGAIVSFKPVIKLAYACRCEWLPHILLPAGGARPFNMLE